MDKEEEKQYMDAFNIGYKIAGYYPEIEQLIKKAEGDGIRLNGLKDGMEQYTYDLDRVMEVEKENEIEKSIEKGERLYNDELNQDRLSDLENGNNSDQDKDFEPDL